MRSLANLLPQTRILGVFEHSISQARRDLGWSMPNFGRVQTIVAPTINEISQIARESPESSIHVLSGLRSPMINEVFAIIAPTQSVIGVISEGRDHRGLLGLIRWWHSLCFEKKYRERVDFVLGIGNLGVRWFENCKYNKMRIFHWAYIVEESDHPEPAATHASNTVEIAYIGQLVQRKGVDILLHALAQVNRSNWRLHVVGHGDFGESLKRLSIRLGIQERVSYIDALPNSLVREVFSKVDVFVLPSRFDGWGAVVNEALMAGTPVVCTDHCGASILVESSGFGAVATAQSAKSMAHSLSSMIDRGPLDPQARKAIRDWTDCIRGERAAEFFLEIIQYCEEGGARPIAPWMRSSRHRDCIHNDRVHDTSII